MDLLKGNNTYIFSRFHRHCILNTWTVPKLNLCDEEAGAAPSGRGRKVHKLTSQAPSSHPEFLTPFHIFPQPGEGSELQNTPISTPPQQHFLNCLFLQNTVLSLKETVIREWNIKVHHTFISRSFSWKGHVEGWKNRFVEADSCNRIQILFEPVGYQNAFYLFSSLMKYSERQLKVLLTAAIWAEETPSIYFYVSMFIIIGESLRRSGNDSSGHRLAAIRDLLGTGVQGSQKSALVSIWSAIKSYQMTQRTFHVAVKILVGFSSPF